MGWRDPVPAGRGDWARLRLRGSRALRVTGRGALPDVAADGLGSGRGLNPDRGIQQIINLTPSRDIVLTCGKLPLCEVPSNSKVKSVRGLSLVVCGRSLYPSVNA